MMKSKTGLGLIVAIRIFIIQKLHQETHDKSPSKAACALCIERVGILTIKETWRARQ
jgi:hypothetical protein